jgi:Flp pilus assembly protein TadG
MSRTSRLVRRFRQDRRGQALVEFALVVPILLLLVLGIFDFGRAWNLHQTITHAAREGAREAAMFDDTRTQDEVTDVIEAAITASGFDPSAATISFDNFKAGRSTTVTVGISMPYRFGFLAPLISLLNADGNNVVTMRTFAQFRNE